MRGRDAALLGNVLLERAVLPDARALDDVLARQSQRLPIASVCYVLGYAPERPLIAALVSLRGCYGVVLDESLIHLEVLGSLARETAARARILPIYEDMRRVILAVADLEQAAPAAQELERVRGRRVEMHLALEITLARTIRGCYLARQRGDQYWLGIEAIPDPTAPAGKVAVVAPDDPEAGRTDDAARAHRALLDDVTKEIAVTELMLDEDISASIGRAFTTGLTTGQMGAVDESQEISTGRINSPSSSIDTPWPGDKTDVDDDQLLELIAELDAAPPPPSEGPPRVLIVDDDFATRHFLVKELQPLGYGTITASTGGEAVRMIRQSIPDLVVADIMLPEIDGFRLCRAIKRSRMLINVPVVLMSAVIDSGRVTDEVLARYGADAYLEKPLDTRRMLRAIRELLVRRRGGGAKSIGGESSFQRSIALYQRGDVDGAIVHLREAVEADPTSAKYRFVLANLLQRSAQVTEAIDEYESVVLLEPEYFPALTRLAYLYYRQGLLARAVDTWRRSLPLCADAGLRRNIELFMRKLIAEMGAVTGAQ